MLAPTSVSYTHLDVYKRQTVYNAAYNFVQFWDGRAGTLAEQAAGPPLNPVEMACESFDQIISKLAEDKNFVVAFNEVYPDGLNEKNITNAIQDVYKRQDQEDG